MKKNKQDNPLIASRWKSLIKPLFTFFVIAIPALLIWMFFSSDWGQIPGFPHYDAPLWLTFLIAIAFIVGTFLITLLFVYLKMLDISVFTFSIPVSLCFMAIYVSQYIEQIWARALIIIPFIFTIIPVSIIVKKIEIKLIIKKRDKEKTQEKIIGYKEKEK